MSLIFVKHMARWTSAYKHSPPVSIQIAACSHKYQAAALLSLNLWPNITSCWTQQTGLQTLLRD